MFLVPHATLTPACQAGLLRPPSRSGWRAESLAWPHEVAECAVSAVSSWPLTLGRGPGSHGGAPPGPTAQPLAQRLSGAASGSPSRPCCPCCAPCGWQARPAAAGTKPSGRKPHTSVLSLSRTPGVRAHSRPARFTRIKVAGGRLLLEAQGPSPGLSGVEQPVCPGSGPCSGSKARHRDLCSGVAPVCPPSGGHSAVTLGPPGLAGQPHVRALHRPCPAWPGAEMGPSEAHVPGTSPGPCDGTGGHPDRARRDVRGGGPRRRLPGPAVRPLHGRPQPRARDSAPIRHGLHFLYLVVLWRPGTLLAGKGRSLPNGSEFLEMASHSPPDPPLPYRPADPEPRAPRLPLLPWQEPASRHPSPRVRTRTTGDGPPELSEPTSPASLVPRRRLRACPPCPTPPPGPPWRFLVWPGAAWPLLPKTVSGGLCVNIVGLSATPLGHLYKLNPRHDQKHAPRGVHTLLPASSVLTDAPPRTTWPSRRAGLLCAGVCGSPDTY